MVACTLPQLIAACHVLHRLHAPRHPPCALSSLTIKFAQSKLLSRESAPGGEGQRAILTFDKLRTANLRIAFRILISRKALDYLFSCQRAYCFRQDAENSTFKLDFGFHLNAQFRAFGGFAAGCCRQRRKKSIISR